MQLLSRFLGLFLVLSHCCAFAFENTNRDDESAEPSKQPRFGRRFDREKKKSLRGMSGSSFADISGLKKMTWNVGDTTREALVYLPPSTSTSKKVPLIFAFHGHGGTSGYAARKLAFHVTWPEAICIYPQGLPTAVPVIDPEGQRNGWQKNIGDQDDRDLRFFDRMLATMKSDYEIDERRIYSSGHSNGGYFTYILWAARGETFAALAPIAGTMVLRHSENLKPIPIIHVAGEKDPIVRFRLQEWTMERDRKLNECVSEGKPAGNFCTEYSSPKGAPVVTFIHPGGHEVPEGAIKRITQFFQEHPKK